MKNYGMAFALLLVSFAAFAQEQVRFRDMEWGASAATTTGLSLVESNSGLKCYTRTHEKLQVGDAALQRIRYCYYQDKLGFVMIDYKGQRNQLIIKDVLDQKFGAGYQDNQFMDDYWWMLGQEVAIHMDYSDVSTEGTVIYRFKPVSDAMSSNQSSSNKEAAKDL